MYILFVWLIAIRISFGQIINFIVRINIQYYDVAIVEIYNMIFDRIQRIILYYNLSHYIALLSCKWHYIFYQENFHRY